MSVRKPLEKNIDSQIDINELISKGAHVMEDNNEVSSKKEWTNINLRIPIEMLKEIDEVLKSRVGISRTGWILESMQKILRNENVR